MENESVLDRHGSGIPGLDKLLGGGFPRSRLYVVQGNPGTGKTTLALQFLLEGHRQGERGLYITFSETKRELTQVSKSHGWDISGISLLDLTSMQQRMMPESQNTLFRPSEVELGQVIKLLLDEIEKVKPERVVFDSISELLLLAESPLRYRKQVLSLKQVFLERDSTVLFLDDLTSTANDLQIQSIAHGVIQLERIHKDFGGARRRLNIVKLRGAPFGEGYHDYVIKKGGVVVFPRMVSAEYGDRDCYQQVSTGLKELDLLLGGGLDRGTSSLFVGPAGTGKSTIAAKCAITSAQRGERVSIFLFDENVSTYRKRLSDMGMDIGPFVESGHILLKKVNPASLSPGEFSEIISESVEEADVKMVIVDSLNGYIHAMVQEDALILQLHELLAFLSLSGVITIFIMAQQGMIGNMQSPVDLTYLADMALMTRFFEAKGAVRKAVSVIKKRSGSHENTIREFFIDKEGVRVGHTLDEFQGVLSGIPTLLQQPDPAIGPKSNA